MKTKNIEDMYPLSPMQQGLLFHTRYASMPALYFVQWTCLLRGDLDLEAFQRAWQTVVDRHPSLRTIFLWEGLDEPMQVVRRQVNIPWEIADWRDLPAAERHDQLHDLLETDQQRGFDLARAPLMRLCLIRLDQQTYRLIWSFSHLLLDGWSALLVLKDVFAHYGAFRQGHEIALRPGRPYRDYIAWLQQHDMSQAEAFWRSALKGFAASTPLTVDRPKGTAHGTYADHQIHLSAASTTALQAFARAHQLTLSTLIQGAWGLLLSRYSGEADIVFGTVVSGRPHALAGAESMVGLFINTLPARMHVSPAMALLPWLKAFQDQQVEARQFEHSPLVQVQGWSEVRRGLPLFETLVTFENYPTGSLRFEEGAGCITVSGARIIERTNYPLTVSIIPQADLALKFMYDTSRFEVAAICRMAGHLQTLLEGMLAAPRRLGDLPLLTEAERHQILVEWNATHKDYGEGQYLHTIVEAQVERTPDAVALIFDRRPTNDQRPTTKDKETRRQGGKETKGQEDGAICNLPGQPTTDNGSSILHPPSSILHPQSLTYGELNRRANQLAHYLRKLGVGPNTLVGICMERSLELVVGLLGILKAGGAYVPLDPAYPHERLAFMLEDSRAPVLLTATTYAWGTRRQGDKETRRQGQEHGSAQVHPPSSILYPPSSSWVVVDLVTDWPTIATESPENPTNIVGFDTQVYMIYTSGSTGKPKGAMNTHGGVCNRLLWMQDAYQLTPSDHILQKTPFSFDVSVWEFFWPLMIGARLVVARPGGHQDSAYLVRLIAEQQITTIHFVPSMLQIFLEEQGLEHCACLKRVICSGEALPFDLQERFFTRLGAELHNLYGPTEAAVDVTFWGCKTESGLWSVPIGRPIANTQIYLLDARLQPVPIGVAGELHIGGVGLARGYHNRPDLTAERFIPNPFADQRPTTNGHRPTERAGDLRSSFVVRRSSDRLYKTGDLARYRADGSIEYLGRIDQQVKLRGFRIELGEIEAVLRQHPAVAEAVVAVREDLHGSKRLVGYVVPKVEDRGLKIEDSSAAGNVTLSSILYPLSSTQKELRNYLQERLPEYMIPSTFIVIQAVPLSPNGKADRRALPAPEAPRPQLNSIDAAPRTAIERTIASIWKEVLHVDAVGLHDNFFELGGHSLLVGRVYSKLRETGASDMSMVDLFQYPTVNALAHYLSRQPTAPESDDADDRLKAGRNRLKQQLRQRQRS